MNTQIDLYKLKIYDLYEPLWREDVELDNYKLATIFEYYSCIKMMEKYI